MVPSSSNNCKYKDYKAIEDTFKAAGFTNISTKILYDIVLGWTSEGEVDSVTIGGKKDFNRGDVFDKNSSVIITYHMKEEDDPNKKQASNAEPNKAKNNNADSVYYSTNKTDTYKNGNLGKYSYKKSGTKNAYGGWYDIYYIIDFDEGFVYYFCEGYGSESEAHGGCDKVKITSGTLNDVLIITYHDGGNTWQEGLHFKWKNQPNHMVHQDSYGYEVDFLPTDLSEALRMRNSKKITNY